MKEAVDMTPEEYKKFIFESGVKDTHGGGRIITMNAEQKSQSQTTQTKSTMKNILTNKNTLVGAGIGAGTGLAISWLMGVRGGNMFGITATATIIGGLVGSSGGESFHSAMGGQFKPQLPVAAPTVCCYCGTRGYVGQLTTEGCRKKCAE